MGEEILIFGIMFMFFTVLTNSARLNIIEYKEINMAKTITLRVDDNVYNTLKRAADGDRRTISNYIEYATMNYILSNNIVDDTEMNEVLFFEKGIKKGIEDINKGRYKIIE